MVEAKSKLAQLFRDWLNNYLTVARFAEVLGVTESKALRIIDIGRKCHKEGY
jgi:hypothetical protein